MAIPEIDWSDHSIEILPQYHRTPRFIAWIQGVVFGSIGWLNQFFYRYYYGDSISDMWSSVVSYQLNDTVATYFGTYVSLSNGNIDNNPNSNPDKWYQVSQSYIGVYERGSYNSQKLIFEDALNRYFRTVFRQPTSYSDGTAGVFYLPKSDIWIATKAVTITSFISYGVESLSSASYATGSGSAAVFPTVISATDTTYQYTVWIPTSLSVSLGLDYIKIVSNVVNLIGIVGTSFTVNIY